MSEDLNNPELAYKKKCNDCGELKDCTHFYKNSNYSDGYTNKCRECTSKYVNKKKKEKKKTKRKKTGRPRKKTVKKSPILDIGSQVADAINELVEVHGEQIGLKIAKAAERRISRILDTMKKRLHDLRAEHIKSREEFRQLKDDLFLEDD